MVLSVSNKGTGGPTWISLLFGFELKSDKSITLWGFCFMIQLPWISLKSHLFSSAGWMT